MNKTYEVTITATIRKTITVGAPDADYAEHLARDCFTTECDGEEYYTETTNDIEELTC